MKSSTATPTCDLVAERIALGDALGELQEHVASCDRCQRLVDLPARLGATRTPIDPGLGFAARMTAGAQNRLVVRRRRRIAAGVIATMAAGVVGVFLFTRTPAADEHMAALELPTPLEEVEQPQPLPDADLAALIRFSDTKRSRRLGAHWARIARPLAPYKNLVANTKVHP